ncbi:competence/damage-inducible protein A [uncultured Sneathiella sp.]|jgi:molybdenum cofactor synthesis domain-containing protein|uniref:competence/damage-inducible protein A n=1 Tax=uncultured Sneathiella sp. TaxID=879315 RepID=UPI0030D7B1E3|tara:strand:+ start:23590 stop:24363 length:774 start_codon:yes stop_codon:yes gene_type:complete
MSDPTSSSSKTVTAAVLLIGDEILSGRTQDKNMAWMAGRLTEIGVQLREARVVPDIEAEIVAAVNTLRAKFDYVFTTGGIGPTHDDITADSMAAAFGVSIDHHPEAMAILTRHYETSGIEFNTARKRMARIPDGASLINNPVSKAPGFRLENVYVMAGVPTIMQAMFEEIAPELKGGAKMQSRTIGAGVPEGKVADALGELQSRYPDVSMGSYPYFRQGEVGTNLVLRSTDVAALNRAFDELMQAVAELGAVAIETT